MVSSSKRLPTTVDALVTNRRIGNDLYGLNRLRNTTRTVQPPPRSGAPSQGSSGSSSGTGLKTVGDSMIGPIAFFPVDASITDDTIDISASGNSPSDFSTNVRLLPEGGVDDDLLTIFGSAFDGQLLYLQGAANLTVTIIEGTAGNGGNILTNGESVKINGGEIFTLLFDMSADTGDAAVNGAWRIVAGGGGATNLTGNMGTTFGNQQTVPSGQFTKVNVFDVNVLEDGVTVDTANNELVITTAGRYLIGVNISVASSESGTIGQWTLFANGTQLGDGTFLFFDNTDELSGSASTTVLDITNVPVTLDVRVDQNKGSNTEFTYSSLSLYASTMGGGAGSGGGGSLGGLSDVELSNVQTNDVLTFDGNDWINSPPSAASQSPWVTDINGDGYNLDFNQNGSRPAPAITNLKNIQLGVWNGSVFPKGTINVEPDRFELNVTESTDDFFIKSNSDPILQYDASQTRWKTFVDFSMSSNTLREVLGITFAGVNVVPAAGVPEIYYAEDATHEEMVFNAKLGGKFQWLLGGVLVPPIMELGFETIDGFTYGNIRNVVRIELPNTSVQFPGATDGDIQQVLGDVIIQSGGQARNISNIGSGGGSDRIVSADTNTNVIANNGSVTTQVEGMIRSTLSDTVYTIGVPLNLGTQGIQSVNFITPNNATAIIGNNSNFWEFMYTQNVIFGNTNNKIFGDNGGLDFDVGSGNNFKFSALNQLFQIGPNSCQITNGNLEMNQQRITNIPLVPSADGDAASKKYVDDNSGGSLVGTIEEAIWTTHQTDQFDFDVYHSNSNNYGADFTFTATEDNLFFVPIFLGKNVTITGMAIEIKAGSGTHSIAFGIYSNRSDGQNYPDTKLVQGSTSISVGTNGVKTLVLNNSLALSAGLYWLAYVDTSGNYNLKGYEPGNAQSVGWQRDGTTGGFMRPISGYVQGHSSQTLPTTPDDEMLTFDDLGFDSTPAIFARFS